MSSVMLVLLVAGCGDPGSDQFSGSAPTAQEIYGSCAYCHSGTAERMAARGGHHDLDIKCESCHADLKPNDPGPGHRRVPACADCHTTQITHHDGASSPAEQCQTCHTPHGSLNLLLIRQRITPPGGAAVSVTFNNLAGKADGSFASLTQPGSGVCEVCHTATNHYRRDGSGSPHFTFPCQTCHSHSTGFAPPP